MKFDNRLRLMKQHFQSVDADIIGICEMDSVSGSQSTSYFKFVNMMKDIGYVNQYFEKSSFLSG